MAATDDGFCGFVTPEDKALEGIANVFRVLAIGAVIAIAWIVAVVAAIIVAARASPGSFAGSLAVNLLAALLLVVAAPWIIHSIARRRRTAWLFAAGAAAVLAAAACATGAWRDFLLNAGSGLCLVLGVDYYVARRFSDWTDRIGARAQELGRTPSHPVLF